MPSTGNPREQSKHADVLIIGGGPIGLAHAWGLKAINPNLKIVVLEKYEEYQRSHNLIMQPEQLEKLIRATGTERNPVMSGLLKRLKNNSRIRTNELEKIFKDFAIKSGVKIINTKVRKKTIKKEIQKYSPNLIIGADGTHSIVSRTLFPKNNQIKYEFDYVLQLRYEIEGEEKAENINAIDFFQMMEQHGFIANEYVGHYDIENKKTPVTMQMMISKESYEQLKAAKSNNPIHPYVDNTKDDKAEEVESSEQEKVTNNQEVIKELPYENVPKNIQKFIDDYITAIIKSNHYQGQKIDSSSIRISVNEAPATQAKEIYTIINAKNAKNIPVVLVGDAGLGLSYFKGLNAGLESSAKLLSILAPSIKNNLTSVKELFKGLNNYENWFLNDFAPRKVKEVATYSALRIRAAWKFIKATHAVKTLSVARIKGTKKTLIEDYLKLIANDPLSKQDEWRLYPHRNYDPINPLQLKYIPITYTLKRIAKIFIDFVKPYKSTFHVLQDFQQPFLGIGNLGAGLAKIIAGLFTLNGKHLADGIFRLSRGIIEIACTPLTLFVKPITRGIATLVTVLHKGKPKIENNAGMKRLAKLGLEKLEKLGEKQILSNQEMYALLAVANDLHRKYDKGYQKGQATNRAVEEEYQFKVAKTYIHKKVAAGKNDQIHVNREQLKNYFNLFANVSPNEKTPAQEKFKKLSFNSQEIPAKNMQG